MRFLRILLIILGIVFYLASSTASPTTSVVFDTSTGFFGIDSQSSVGMSTLRDELMLEGFDAADNVLMNIEADEITDRLLKRSNVLVLVNPNREFSEKEKDLVKNFVENGGKLLLVSDTPESAEYMNDLSMIFGAEFLGGYYLGQSLTAHATNEYLVSHGVNTISLTTPTPLRTFVQPEISIKTGFMPARAWFSRWEQPADVISNDTFVIFAGLKHGNGKVAFLGDKDILLNGNIVREDDLQFILTVFNWLADKEPRSIRTGISVELEPELLKIKEVVPPAIYLLSPLNISVHEGEERNFSIIIKNQKPENATIRVSVEGITFVEAHEEEFVLSDEHLLNLTVHSPECVELISSGDDRAVFQGKIVFSNERIYNTPLIVEVLKKDDSLQYYPEHFKFITSDGKPALLFFTVRNVGRVNQTISIMVPDYLASVTTIDKPTVFLPAGSTERIEITMRSTEYGSISDYIIVERSNGCQDYIPMEVVS